MPKRTIPTEKEIVDLSLSEMEESIKYLAKIRDGKTTDGAVFDNKDKSSAAKTLVDVGKHLVKHASENKLFDDDRKKEAEEQEKKAEDLKLKDKIKEAKKGFQLTNYKDSQYLRV